MTLLCYYKVPRERNFQAADRLDDTRMKCQRCLSGEEATYRVYSDALEMAVCAACADEARRLGIAVEVLDRKEGKNNQTKNEFAVQGYRVKLSA